MEPRITLATLAARDLPALTRFYERLGWTPAFANDEVSFFQMNGLVFGLWRRDDFARAVGARPEDLRPGASALAHNVRAREDVDRILEEARAAGARIVQAAHDADWGGRSGHFADPEGFLWEVAWNPAWPLGPDGSVTIPA